MDLAASLGEWKKTQKKPGEKLTFSERILGALGIARLELSPLECILVECVLTRGKYDSSIGIRAWLNQIKEGRRDSSEFDVDNLYEIVEQWRTNSNFTVSAKIFSKHGNVTPRFFELQKGVTIKIHEGYGCAWWPLHRWFLIINSLLYCFRLLDVGSSVEVYPEKWETI